MQCPNIQGQCTNYVLCYEQKEHNTTKKNLSEKSVDTVTKGSHLYRLENPFLKIKTVYKGRATCLTFSEVKAESISYFSW